jgi:hypothetical protein
MKKGKKKKQVLTKARFFQRWSRQRQWVVESMDTKIEKGKKKSSE